MTAWAMSSGCQVNSNIKHNVNISLVRCGTVFLELVASLPENVQGGPLSCL